MTDFRPYDSMPVSVPEGTYASGEFGIQQPYSGGPVATVAVNRSPIFWIRRELTEAFFRVLQNWWLVLGLWCIVSMGLGYGVAVALGKQTWKSTEILNYQPANNGEYRDNNKSSTLKELQGLATHHDTLTKTAEALKTDPDLPKEVKLPINKKALEASLTVTQPQGTNQLLLTFKWDSKEGANYLLGKIQEQFQAGVLEFTKSTAQSSLVEIEKQIKSQEEALRKLTEDQAKAMKAQGITDIKGDQAALKDSITSLEYQLRLDNQAEVGAKEEYREVLRQLDDLKKTAQKEAESEEDDQAQADSISDNRRRQDRIRELMQDEKERISLEAQLKEKNFKRVRLESLLQRNAVAKSEVDEVTSEIRTIKAKMDGNKKTIELDNEMQKIDKLIVPKKGKKMATSPIITQMLDKKMDRELKMLGLAMEKQHLTAEIEAAKAKLANITGMEGRFDDHTSKIANAKLALSNLIAKKSIYENQTTTTRSELIPYGQPATNEGADGSTKPLLFGISSLGGICLGLFTLLGWEIFARAGTPSNLARRLEIPVPDLRSRPEELARQSRNISRQLRQRDPGQGMILTVHPVAATDSCIEKSMGVAKELGASFSKRGERVLIIQLDTGAKGSATLGLSDYLFNRVDSPAMVIRPTDDLSCDMLPAGSENLDADSLANQRMTDFMEQARERYGVIIIVGHALNNLSEVEILASNSQSIVLVADGEKPIGSDAREALFELSRMRAPVSAMMIR